MKTINEYLKKKIELLGLDSFLINTLNTISVDCANLPFQLAENRSMVCVYFSNEADEEKIKQVLRHNKYSVVYHTDLNGKKCSVLFYINEQELILIQQQPFEYEKNNTLIISSFYLLARF